MYPPQTSLIPVTVALARFIETHGFFGTYPFWYLGVPTNFLTGPIIPAILIILHKLLPVFDYFQLSFFLIFLSFLLGSLGWGKLTVILSGNKKLGLLVGFLFLILPWRWLSALALSETSVIVALNLLPWVLIMVNNYFTQYKRKSYILSILSVSVLLLINTSVIPSLIIGVAALILGFNLHQKNGEDGEDEGDQWVMMAKKAAGLIFLALIIVTFWYTPKFWFTLLVNPSLGGAIGFESIFHLLDFLKGIVPLILAVVGVFWISKLKNKFQAFSLVWLLTFFLLTVFRYLANPDFWQDWTTWFFELEIGIIFLIVHKKTVAMGLAIAVVSFTLSFYVYGKLGTPALISNSLPKGITSLEKVNDVVKGSNQLVFLSGSTVFWANSLYDFSEVRGGRDEVSTNSDWLKASYEIREGVDPDLTKESLQKLNVRFVLVHDNWSSEHYHDFKHIEKWENVGIKVWEKDGDMLYQI